MKLKVTKAKPREENLVPLINVVFLMLIFFLVAASLRQFQARGIAPVTMSEVEVSEAPKGPLVMDKSGKVMLNGALVDNNELADLLTRKVAAAKQGRVFVVADKELAADKFVDFLQAAKTAGVQNIKLVAKRRRD